MNNRSIFDFLSLDCEFWWGLDDEIGLICLIWVLLTL